MAKAAITRERIDELLHFLPTLGNPGPDTEPVWRGLDKLADGVFTMPCPTYPPAVEEFFALAGQDCWCDPGYMPGEAGELVRDDAAIASASLAQIKTMLTFCVRGERFCDGHWGAMVQEGRIGAILRRLRHLRDEVPDAEPIAAPAPAARFDSGTSTAPMPPGRRTGSFGEAEGAPMDETAAGGATPFQVGQTYSRQEISAALGGSVRSYLPTVVGRVVCGCFKRIPAKNPGAPEKVTFGNAHRPEPGLVTAQPDPIPVFVFRSPRAWEYLGQYRCTGLSTEPELLRREMQANPARGVIAGVLYFERVRD